jgi:hypothetical protein
MKSTLAALRKFTPHISVFGAVFMVICDGLGIWLNPSYDPLRAGISKLALVVPTGWLEKLGFGILGLCILVTALSLATSALSKSNRVFLSLSLLLALNGLGFVVISIFNTDVGAAGTLNGIIHVAAAAMSGSVSSLFALIFTIGFRKDTALRSYVLYTMIVGLYAAIGGLVYLLLPDGAWFGLGLYERTLMVLTLVWLGLVGTGLLKAANANSAD